MYICIYICIYICTYICMCVKSQSMNRNWESTWSGNYHAPNHFNKWRVWSYSGNQAGVSCHHGCPKPAQVPQEEVCAAPASHRWHSPQNAWRVEPDSVSGLHLLAVHNVFIPEHLLEARQRECQEEKDAHRHECAKFGWALGFWMAVTMMRQAAWDWTSPMMMRRCTMVRDPMCLRNLMAV